MRFVRNNLICRFGLQESIISDNARNLDNDIMTELCQQFKTTHRHSTPYHPKMNGAVKLANKNLKTIMQKIFINYKAWHDMLPLELMAYHISIRTSTKATPNSLVYETEAVIPVEANITTLRILMDFELEQEEWVHERHEQLCLIDKRRLTALCHSQCCQKRIARAYN